MSCISVHGYCHSLCIITVPSTFLILISMGIMPPPYYCWVTKVILKIKDKSALRWVDRWVCPCLFHVLNSGTCLPSRTHGVEQWYHSVLCCSNVVVGSANCKVAVATLHVGMTGKPDGGYTHDFNGTIFAGSRYHSLANS